MREFLIGLLFIIAFLTFGIIVSALSFLLFPLLLLVGIILRIVIAFAIVILGIWLIGKIVLFIWEKLQNRKSA